MIIYRVFVDRLQGLKIHLFLKSTKFGSKNIHILQPFGDLLGAITANVQLGAIG